MAELVRKARARILIVPFAAFIANLPRNDTKRVDTIVPHVDHLIKTFDWSLGQAVEAMQSRPSSRGQAIEARNSAGMDSDPTPIASMAVETAGGDGVPLLAVRDLVVVQRIVTGD